MPRISMWREKHGSDYKFIDRRISEMFTIGGTGILLHKYLGVEGGSGADATVPAYNSNSPLNIQDLLFVENRDRKYDTSVYSLRGIYQKQDQDFDLSQFGIFLAAGTQFMTFHLNDVVEVIGRKIMAGDVLEFMHMKDFYNLDDSIPFAIKRFYVVTDVSWAAEGFSPTWYPHLWRCKLQPLVDSQEYKDILNKIGANDDPFAGNIGSNTNPALSTIVSTYDKFLGLNEAIIAQAEIEVPEAGYDTTKFFTVGRSTNGQINNPKNTTVANGNIDISGNLHIELTTVSARTNSNRILVANNRPAIVGATVSSASIFAANGVTITGIIGKAGVILSSNVTVANNEVISLSYASKKATTDSSASTPAAKVKGYLSGDGTAPNGLTVAMGIAFPSGPKNGDYFLRLDYVPNRLFRYDGVRWIKIEDNVRTNMTPGASDNKTLRSGFVNNENTMTGSSGTVYEERQSLSKILKK